MSTPLDIELKDGIAAFDIDDDILEQWQSIVDSLAKLMHVPAALIMRLNDKKIEVYRTSLGDNNPYKLLDNEHFFDSGLYCETVIRTKEKLQVPYALEDEDWKDNPDVALDMTSYLGFPISHADNTPFGTLCILDNHKRNFTQEEENLLLQFKNMIENHLKLISTLQESNELNKKLERMAYYDHLTNIYNRRYFFTLSQTTIALAQRDCIPLSLAMIDIDNFKNINDTYGHDRGDTVIQTLTTLVSKHIRQSDIFARFGGEEFILLLPNTQVINAIQLLEKIREAVAANTFKGEVSFTISVGISEFDFAKDNLEGVIKRADTSLYEAKNGGKNKVCSS